MKNKETIILVIAIIALVVGLIALAQPKEITLSESNRNTITVTGEAEKFVAPDTASISFTLTHKNANLETARASVDDRVKTILETLKEDGVEEKDIKTVNFSVRPEYVYTSGRSRFDGYRVTQTMELTIRDLDTAAIIVGKVGGLQVDSVSGLQFYVEEDEEIREELRAEAIDNAKDQAKKLARDLGVSLDDIVSFSENGGGKYYPEPIYNRLSIESAFDEAFEQASLPAGENEYKSSVSITYSLDK